MSENREETDRALQNERDENDGKNSERTYDQWGRPVAGRDEDPNDGNLLPDEVLVESSAKLAHEDLPVRTLNEADVEETRAGGDFDGAPSAAELRQKRIEETDEEAPASVRQSEARKHDQEL